MTAVLVVGGSGFLGSACVSALREADVQVTTTAAPRVRTTARTGDGVLAELSGHAGVLDELGRALEGHEVVVNCAGLAAANSPATDQLYGANAVVPALIARAGQESGLRRVVQVSTAAVQGRADPLRECARTSPFSPYSHSKALGEQVSRALDAPGLVIFRPTSVHGPGRASTDALRRLARSPLASTAGSAPRPTPQVLIQNVAAAVAFLCTYAGDIPPIVLQPSEGLTTDGVLRLLGANAPRQVPLPLARAVVGLGYRGSSVVRRGGGWIRRLEMLWLGQGQDDSWLVQAGFRPPAGLAAWRDLAESSRRVT